MTYSQYDKPVPKTSKEDNKKNEFGVFGKKQEHNSHPDDKSFQDVIQEKIDESKSSIQEMAHRWRDDIMEPFEDRSDQNEVEQTGKRAVDNIKEQSSKATNALNGVFKDSTQKVKETATANDHESYQEILQDKIDEGKSSIKETTHKLRDNIMETFGDRSDQSGVKAADSGNGTFKDSTQKAKERATANDHESYQEILQDKIDEGKNTIKETTHKLRDEIMETFGDRSDQNDAKQAGEELRDKTKEQSSKVQSTWNGILDDSDEKNRIKNGSSCFDEGFKTFGQEAKEEYEMDKRQADEAKAEWESTFESVKHSVEDALGNSSNNDTDRKIDEKSPEYRNSEVLRESAGGAILPPFDPTNEPYTEGNTLSFTKFQK